MKAGCSRSVKVMRVVEDSFPVNLGPRYILRTTTQTILNLGRKIRMIMATTRLMDTRKLRTLGETIKGKQTILQCTLLANDVTPNRMCTTTLMEVRLAYW